MVSRKPAARKVLDLQNAESATAWIMSFVAKGCVEKIRERRTPMVSRQPADRNFLDLQNAESATAWIMSFVAKCFVEKIWKR